jgi:hypothetical protein
MFFYHSIESSIECKDFFFFFYFGRTLAAFSIFGECAKIFQQLLKALHRDNISTMGGWILSDPQQNKML